MNSMHRLDRGRHRGFVYGAGVRSGRTPRLHLWVVRVRLSLSLVGLGLDRHVNLI